MKPGKQDIEQMMTALLTVVHSTQRARSKGAASRLATLAAIATQPGVTPSALSEELTVHPSSITRQIQALEREGAVRVAADPEDGRSCRVRLTAAGRAELSRLNKLSFQRYAAFVASWTSEEVRALTTLLVKLEQSKSVVSRSTHLIGGRWRTLKNAALPQLPKDTPSKRTSARKDQP